MTTSAMTAVQGSLFDGAGPPSFDPDFGGRTRVDLGDGAWVDYAPQWLTGHERVYRDLAANAEWVAASRTMYARRVAVPRLTAAAPRDAPPGALLRAMAGALGGLYATTLDGISLAWYRDGRDSVAPHGDKLAHLVDDTVVAIVSVGAPRRFVLRPAAGGRARVFALGWGDLLAMGGTCQRTWRHGVPKVARAEPRISIVFRPRVTPG